MADDTEETMKALITGISGQDGAYLAQQLLDQGYEVVGAARRSASGSLWRLDKLGIKDDIQLIELELQEPTNINRAVRDLKPDELYNLAAQSFVGSSFEVPAYTTQANALGVCYLLEAIRNESPKTRFYQASTSEMFGKVQETPQKETTPFYPRSPYGVSKLYAHWLTVNYRESYGLHATSGILFNHESPLRGSEFVTQKIAQKLARIVLGDPAPLTLGNLEARRDWGFAPEYTDAMRLMLQQEEPDDYVLATGQTTSIKDFTTHAAQSLGMKLEWEGEGLETRAYWTDRQVLEVSPEFYRPAEVDVLQGDATKARQKLGWRPTTSAETLAKHMTRCAYDEA